MKRRWQFWFVVMGLGAVLAGCLGSMQKSIEDGKDISEEEPRERTEIRVAVQDYFLSAPIGYIVEHNLDEQFGLRVILVKYPSGAEQIQDMDKDVFDVATIGSACLYPMAEDKAVLIGEHVRCSGGNAIFVRKGSPILQVKGFNPLYQEVYGDSDTVRGSRILLKENTTSQYLGMKWLESIGVRSDFVEIEYMDFEGIFQKFQNGYGDVAVLPAPYTYQAEKEGYVKVASMNSLYIDNFEVILATNQAYGEKQEELLRFLQLLLYANEELESDFDKKFEACESWYEQNGVSFTRDSLEQECKDKIFVTRENYSLEKFGQFEYKYAEYMAAIGNIEPMTLKNVKENMDPELWKKAF